MTSRERITAALKHSETDMVPLDLGGTESSGITGIAYNRLREFLGLEQGETRIIDVYQQIAAVEDDVRDMLGLDTVPLIFEPVAWKPFPLPDGSLSSIPVKWNPVGDERGDLVVRNDDDTVTARMPGGGFYFESVHTPLAAAEQPSDLDVFDVEIETFDWPSHADESLESIADRAKRLHETTDYAIVANLQLHLLAAGQILRGYETFMTDLMLNKTLAHALLERLTDAYIRRCGAFFERTRDYIQVVLVNDDLGTQHGPMISPDCYREMLLPCQKRLFSFIREHSGAFILFHSCGSVHRFIPDLAAAGVDALNPVQVSAEGMDDKLTFMLLWGQHHLLVF